MADYGFKGYIDTTKDKHQEELKLMNLAILDLQEKYNIVVGYENCELHYDRIHTKPVYNTKVHYWIGNDAYNDRGEYIGTKGYEIHMIGEQVPCIVFITLPYVQPQFNIEVTSRIILERGIIC